MDLNKVIEAAKLMEMAQREVKFIKNNTLQQPTNEYSLDSLTKYQKNRWYRPHPSNDYSHNTSYNKPNPSRKQTRTIEICRYCGRRVPHNGRCKARDQT